MIAKIKIIVINFEVQCQQFNLPTTFPIRTVLCSSGFEKNKIIISASSGQMPMLLQPLRASEGGKAKSQPPMQKGLLLHIHLGNLMVVMVCALQRTPQHMFSCSLVHIDCVFFFHRLLRHHKDKRKLETTSSHSHQKTTTKKKNNNNNLKKIFFIISC